MRVQEDFKSGQEAAHGHSRSSAALRAQLSEPPAGETTQEALSVVPPITGLRYHLTSGHADSSHPAPLMTPRRSLRRVARFVATTVAAAAAAATATALPHRRRASYPGLAGVHVAGPSAVTSSAADTAITAATSAAVGPQGASTSSAALLPLLLSHSGKPVLRIEQKPPPFRIAVHIDAPEHATDASNTAGHRSLTAAALQTLAHTPHAPVAAPALVRDDSRVEEKEASDEGVGLHDDEDDDNNNEGYGADDDIGRNADLFNEADGGHLDRSRGRQQTLRLTNTEITPARSASHGAVIPSHNSAARSPSSRRFISPWHAATVSPSVPCYLVEAPPPPAARLICLPSPQQLASPSLAAGTTTASIAESQRDGHQPGTASFAEPPSPIDPRALTQLPHVAEPPVVKGVVALAVEDTPPPGAVLVVELEGELQVDTHRVALGWIKGGAVAMRSPGARAADPICRSVIHRRVVLANEDELARRGLGKHHFAFSLPLNSRCPASVHTALYSVSYVVRASLVVPGSAGMAPSHPPQSPASSVSPRLRVNQVPPRAAGAANAVDATAAATKDKQVATMLVTASAPFRLRRVRSFATAPPPPPAPPSQAPQYVQHPAAPSTSESVAESPSPHYAAVVRAYGFSPDALVAFAASAPAELPLLLDATANAAGTAAATVAEQVGPRSLAVRVRLAWMPSTVDRILEVSVVLKQSTKFRFVALREDMLTREVTRLNAAVDHCIKISRPVSIHPAASTPARPATRPLAPRHSATAGAATRRSPPPSNTTAPIHFHRAVSPNRADADDDTAAEAAGLSRPLSPQPRHSPLRTLLCAPPLRLPRRPRSHRQASTSPPPPHAHQLLPSIPVASVTAAVAANPAPKPTPRTPGVTTASPNPVRIALTLHLPTPTVPAGRTSPPPLTSTAVAGADAAVAPRTALFAPTRLLPSSSLRELQRTHFLAVHVRYRAAASGTSTTGGGGSGGGVVPTVPLALDRSLHFSLPVLVVDTADACFV
ncbi:hypothetical protein HK405_015899 [Cladochytrium tenue]|nr:hypothetical protein HK405_015899 [Cladochytrium tenue]